MKNCRKRGVAAVLSAVLLLCGGCSMDVEQFLRPPKTQGEQQAVQTALETYIRDSGQADSRYTLCYPVEGDHTAAFVLCDAAGEPLADTDEDAALALAFYAIASAPNDTHINLLRREDSEWISVADVVGASADVLQVAFGDLDGDGSAELITGWDTYNSRDRRLSVFSLSQGLARLSDDRVYTRLFVGDLTADGRDSLLLLHIATDEVTATLETLRGSDLVSLGRVMLDRGIQQFNAMALCRLSDDVHGLYVDAVKGTDTAVTELIYYDEERLHAPFCNQVGRFNTVTARPAGFAMRDVDGDTQMEIPQCTLLPGYAAGESAADYAYRTEWMAWELSDNAWRAELTTVVNAADGYLVALYDPSWGEVTTAYAPDERLLTLMDAAERRPIMRLRPLTEDKDESDDEETYTLLFKAADGYDGCEVWYDEARLDIDTVRYMVSRFG